MAKHRNAKVQTVPLGADLSTKLSEWLLDRYRGDRFGLADVVLFLPNNRAIDAMTAAFVRKADDGLLLPRMVAIGDVALDEKLGSLLDPLTGDSNPVWPAVPDMERLVKLIELVRQHRTGSSAAEALQLGRQLAQTLNDLEIEDKSLDDIDIDHDNADLAAHWSTAYDNLKTLCRESGAWLKERRQLSPAARRSALLRALAARLKADPPASPMIAAGITTAAPAIAELLACVAKLPGGLVVLPHLDIEMPDDDWDALGRLDAATGDEQATDRHRQETHPQYHLKLLLHRMGIARGEVDYFGGARPTQREAVLSQVMQDAFCIADKTVDWQGLSAKRRTLDHLRIVEAEDSADEARAISVLIRQAIETPGRRVALVTPDRELGRRVAAQLLRWDIAANDSAGEPLSDEPPGVLFLELSRLLATDFAPVSLLSVLKHPLVANGDERLAWLEQVRELDLALRGPRVTRGIVGITDAIDERIAQKRTEPKLREWWQGVAAILRDAVASGRADMNAHVAAVVALADRFTGGAIWKAAAGRCLAQFIEEFSGQTLIALSDDDAGSYPKILASLLADVNVRPSFGQHPRIAIYGLLEARLQSADLVICAGLNEGTWPQMPQPDPWLAPHLRRRLDMTGLERNIGLSAHDLASAIGASEVVMTRAKRDRSGPTIASRFLLRLQALMGDKLSLDKEAVVLARLLDQSEPDAKPQHRPAIVPSAVQRRVAISITQMDMLKADPFAFYARNIMKLEPLKAVDADPDAAWKGTFVHKIIESWTATGETDPGSLVTYAETMLNDRSVTPSLRLLWQPRIVAGMQWVASQITANAGEGRTIAAYEAKAEGEICGIRVHGRVDRVDRQADGRLIVIDYKTGSPPPRRKVTAGYALQLGLAGCLIETGGMAGISGEVGGYEYWSLSKKGGNFGYDASPFGKRGDNDRVNADTFASFADGQAGDAIEKWILGTAPFIAKIKPDYAVYKDYDQLMRLQEWIGEASWNEAANDS